MKTIGMISFTVCAALALSSCGNIGKAELDREKIAVTFAREAVRGGYGMVDTGELKSWIDSKKEMVIVDTMPKAESYDKNHLPGALQVLFPIPEMKELDDATKSSLLGAIGADKEKTLVFYCGFVKCIRSHNGAMWAVKLGYKNVFRYPGGIVAWKQAGHPVEASQ